jgi:hypothetical protein
MRFLQHLRRVRQYRKDAYRKQQPGRRPHRLELEALEGRTLPSILFDNLTTATTSDNNGPVIDHVHVELIFWGAGWNTGSNPTLRDNMQNAVDTVLAGPYLSALTQYRNTIGDGTRVGSVTITGTSPPSSFTDANVRAMLQDRIDDGSIPLEPDDDGQLLYFVVPQPGSSSPGLLGLHSKDVFSDEDLLPPDVDNDTFHYGWTVNDGTLDTFTTSFSHELAEAVSDPEGTAVQVNPRSPMNWNEIGDGEAQSFTYRLNGVLVQSYFSQRDHAFIVPTGQAQDFLVSRGRVLTVNGDQLADSNDTITIDRSSAGGVLVTLNDEVAQFEPGAISGIKVLNGVGSDTINVLRTLSSAPVTITSLGSPTVTIGHDGTVHDIQGDVTIENPPNFTTINVDDSADVDGRTVTLDNVQVATDSNGNGDPYGQIRGLAPGNINYEYADTTSVTISTGAGTINVLATGAVTNLISTGGGLDTTVTVGDGSVQGIRGTLNIENPPAFNRITVDDSVDNSPPRVATLDTFTPVGDTSFGRISGLAPADINYEYDDTRSLSIVTNHVTFNVLSTGASTNLLSSSFGSITVDVGNAGSVQGILGALTVAGALSHNVIQVDDSADGTFQTVTHDSFIGGNQIFGRITGLAPAEIDYVYADTTSITVKTGTGGTTVGVQSTGAPLTVVGHSNNTTINVGSTAHMLDPIQSLLTINSAGTVNLNDQGSTAGRSYTLDATQFQWTDKPLVTYSSVAVLNLFTTGNTSLNNGLTVHGTASATATTVTVTDNTRVLAEVGSTTNSLDAIRGELTINGDGRAGSILRIHDEGNSAAVTYTLTASTWQRTGSALIHYSGFPGLILDAGIGAERILVEGTAAGTQTTLNAGFGSPGTTVYSTVFVGDPLDDIQGPLFVHDRPQLLCQRRGAGQDGERRPGLHLRQRQPWLGRRTGAPGHLGRPRRLCVPRHGPRRRYRPPAEFPGGGLHVPDRRRVHRQPQRQHLHWAGRREPHEHLAAGRPNALRRGPGRPRAARRRDL